MCNVNLVYNSYILTVTKMFYFLVNDKLEYSFMYLYYFLNETF